MAQVSLPASQPLLLASAMALPTAMKTATKKAAMKAKRVSKIAKGKFAKALVFRGTKLKTVGGLTREALMKNKRDKVVGKRASAHGKRHFKNVEDWVECMMGARQSLRCEGFVAMNGKTLQGKALYVKTKALRAAKATPA